MNLRTLPGTGPAGRILKHDVVRYLRQEGLLDAAPEEQAPSKQAPFPAVTPQPQQQPAQPSVIATTDEPELVQLKGYSRYMVHTMTQALQIPHMTLGDEVLLDQVLALRQRIKDTSPHNISVLSFMLKACSLALQEFPLLNARIHDLERCELQVLRHHHIGVAMDTPRGLVVPAVQNVQDKSLVDIQRDLDALKHAVRAGQVNADVLNSTFTLSNIGALGVGQSMQAVLAPPLVAMGAVGRMQRLPRFVCEDSMEVTAVQAAHVSWTADHRVLDGATLARFHQVFANYLQDPVSMLLHLK